MCVPPLQGAELDVLNTLVTAVVLSVVCLDLVGDFWQRAKTAPVIPGMGGQRNFTPLARQLAEQENRTVRPGLRVVETGAGVDSIAFSSDPEIIPDDEVGKDCDPML